MNWGYKILAVYGVFVAGILFMVYQSSNQKVDLVTEDYYGKELKYQQEIDETVRANNLSEEVNCSIANNQVLVHFPKDFSGKNITGTIQLYCPSNENNDIIKDFSIVDGNYAMDISGKHKGQYEIHINCAVDKTTYFFKKRIKI